MIEQQTQAPLSYAAKLETLLAWFQDRCGEAYLSGAAARNILAPQALAIPPSGEILIGGYGPDLLNALGAQFPEIKVEDTPAGLLLSLPVGDASAMELTLTEFRARPVEDNPGAVNSGAVNSGAVNGVADINSTLETRDITIHAFAIMVDGDLADPFGGVQHLREKTLHPVESPRVIFREHPEMLLRMARYMAEYGYDVLPETTRFATRDAANILSVSRNTWSEEMNSLLLGAYVDKGLEWLLSTGILRFLLPEVVSLVDFHRSCAVHHKDCWDHTVQVTYKANPDLCTRWAALCHDVGKIWTRSVDRHRQVHFYRHEEFGSVLFEGIAARFHMEPDLADRVASVIRLHGRVNLYESNWTDSAIRRLIRDSGKYLDDLIRFSKADFTSKRPERIAAIRRQLDELQVRIASIHEKASQRSPLPKGLGTLLISELDLPPGPNLGHLRRGLELLCLSGKIESEQDPAYYVEQARTMGIDAIIEIDKKQRLTQAIASLHVEPRGLQRLVPRAASILPDRDAGSATRVPC